MDNWWDRIEQVLRVELADVSDIEQTTQFMIRVGLAAVLGAVLGLERERKGKAAGLRTHMLVSVGSAMFTLLPLQMAMSVGDLSRVLQGLIAGIGFLGAGAILKTQSERDIKGLTSAANIWLTAAIGMACGLGHESAAMLATLLGLVVLAVLPRVEPDNPPSGDRPNGASTGDAPRGETSVSDGSRQAT